MYYVVSMKIIENNLPNDVIENELIYDNSSLVNPTRYPQPVTTFILRKSKKSRKIYNYVLTCLWGIRDSNIMIKSII